jgi:hypothetical protein
MSRNYDEGGIYPPDMTNKYAYLYAYMLATGGENAVMLDSLAKLAATMNGDDVQAAQLLGGKLSQEINSH